MNVLTYGMEGYDVQLLQYALGRAGQEGVRPDGIFGRRTGKALQQFQKREGLAADGVAGKLTWAALYPYIAGYTVHRIGQGDSWFEMARRFDTGVQALQTANPAWDERALPVGETATIPLNMPVVTAQIPYSSLLTRLMLQGLTKRYPFICLYEVGRSVMGQPIMAAAMGQGRRQVGYCAAHHANEWITVPILLRFLEEYAAAYAANGSVGGASAGELYDDATVHILPLVNPDGVDLVTGALPPTDSFYEQARALSAYYPHIPFPSGWKSNIAGIDLNLQYPAGWQIARRIKYAQGYTRPGPRDYVGSEPLITPENRAVAQWTRAHDFALTLSYHTQGRTIYWGDDGGKVPGAKAIGEEMSKNSGYALQTAPYESAHGGYRDWFVQTWRRPGYTIEAGAGENPLPLSQFEEIYGANLPILIRGILLSP